MPFNISAMKLNLVNKIYIALVFLLLTGIVYKILRYKTWDRYAYFSSVSAPATYPVYVRQAYFLTGDGEDDAWFDTKNVNEFQTVWGDESFFSGLSRPMRLPQQLVLQYVSYRDKLFYSDTVELPEAEIRKIFKAALNNKNTDELYNPASYKEALRFVLGIANKGNIVLWIRGKGLEKVVFKTKLIAKEPVGDATRYNRRLPKEAYIEQVFGRLPDSFKMALDQGLEAQANYTDSVTHYLERKN